MRLRSSFAGAFVLLLPTAIPAAAQQSGSPSYLAPVGYQQYTSLASATPLSSVPAGSTMALICAESAGVRWRDDGTDPTASVGQPVGAGQCFSYRSHIVQERTFWKMNAKQFWNLVDHDQKSDPGLEPDQNRMRDEIGQKSQSQK